MTLNTFDNMALVMSGLVLIGVIAAAAYSLNLLPYEIQAAIKILHKEGVKSLFKKGALYVRWIYRAIRFKPAGRASYFTDVLDSSFVVSNGLICPQQVRDEFRDLLALIRNENIKSIVEIGTANGGTLYNFCRMFPKATIVSIDLPNGIHGGGYPWWKTFLYKKFSDKLTLIRADSHQEKTRDRVETLFPYGEIDFLFIDGDHTFGGVKRDFELYAPMVRKGGIIAFHDIAYLNDITVQVPEFWNLIKNSNEYPHTEFVEDWSRGWGGIGIIYKKTL